MMILIYQISCQKLRESLTSQRENVRIRYRSKRNEIVLTELSEKIELISTAGKYPGLAVYEVCGEQYRQARPDNPFYGEKRW